MVVPWASVHGSVPGTVRVEGEEGDEELEEYVEAIQSLGTTTNEV